ncbi:inositol monophosphatase 1-like [Cylas formicarius]|uniref:inositol monophosphatase 1-like n=1 Tax=Cylas formicarius TaxID=197179 RepID=UPI00295839BD|nr:inositol monophosphatase 1-like [Cylas formicarius]
MSRMMADVKAYFDYVLPLVREAGQVLLSTQSQKIEFEAKTPWDLVTEYDELVEKNLVAKIKAKYPCHKFIGEEHSSKIKGKPTLSDDPTWIIDPIDGTTNFTRKIPLVAISVGLTIKKQQLLGIVCNPFSNEVYTAIKGEGAYLNGAKIMTSGVEDIRRSVFCYELSLASTNKYLHDLYMTRVKHLICEVMGIRALGAPVLSLCYVASGKLDAYQCDGLYPWDAAAGTLIVREAGGYVTDSSGKEFDLMEPNFLAASTKKLSDKFMEIERRADEEIRTIPATEKVH